MTNEDRDLIERMIEVRTARTDIDELAKLAWIDRNGRSVDLLGKYQGATVILARASFYAKEIDQERAERLAKYVANKWAKRFRIKVRRDDGMGCGI